MTADAGAALLADPMAVFAYLAGVLALVFWLSGIPRLNKLFEITPPVIYAYFVPTISTTLGIIPPASPVYDWMTDYLLPLALLLLMITVDLRSIARLGGLALLMMCAGTLGIVVGGPIAYLVFGGLLPEDAWMGLAALSGSWIGGTANMVAIKESIGTPDSILGPIIVVDTVVGYGWMGVLLFLSAWQARFDRWNRARTEAIEATNRRLVELASTRRPTETGHAAIILGLRFAASVEAVGAGARLPTISSASARAGLIGVRGGLLLSFSPVRRLAEGGASRRGYAALCLLLTAIGARANLRAVRSAPLYLATGVLGIAIHIAILLRAA